jgi:endoglucanase
VGGKRTWCGGGCGTCYILTNQGYAPPGQGTGAGAGENITVMITNLCPYAGNELWCPPKGQTNGYGYAAHFDIMTGAGLVPGKGFGHLGWGAYIP